MFTYIAQTFVSLLLPHKITTKEQVNWYYSLVRPFKIISDWWYDSYNISTDEIFKQRLCSEFLTYYGMIDDTTEFDKNIMVGFDQYDKDREKYYNTFWCNPINDKYLKSADKVPRISNDTKFSPRAMEKIKDLLKIDPVNTKYPLASKKKEVLSTVEQSISICELICDVDFVEKWSIYNMLGYQLFYIYDNDQYKSCFYLRVSTDKPQAITVPLGQNINLLKAGNTHNLTHELIHAVQYSFEHFLDIPKEIVEVPSMCVENKFQSFDNMLIRLKALALADLIAETSVEFDQFINKLLHQNNQQYKVSHRTWHYVNYPKRFYGYLLGLLFTFTNKEISQIVRDHRVAYSLIEKKAGGI